TVKQLVTIGSPAGQASFHSRQATRLIKHFPVARVEAWLNFTSTKDPVTLGTGIAHLFPRALDIRVTTGTGVQAHAASSYLRTPVVARAVGSALHPTVSHLPAVQERSATLALDLVEKAVLLAFGYNN